jgi:hypothetical protein
MDRHAAVLQRHLGAALGLSPSPPMDLGAHSTLPAPLGATDALWAASVLQLRRGYASGDFTPVDVMHSVLQRVAQCEGALHALWRLNPDGALHKAELSTHRWRAQKPLSLLDGVPVTLKDNIATQGEPMPLGTAATPLVPQLAHAPAAARLDEAGALCFAKTTMPDYGMLSSGLSSFHALARNPWDTTCTPGGSSSGAGAAAAAGYGPLHIGTDIGGSIRLPATWCGVVGFKPSLGRIPIDPPYIGRVAGPLARNVLDVAAAMAVLSLPDGRDTMSLPPHPIDWCAADVDPATCVACALACGPNPAAGSMCKPTCGPPSKTPPSACAALAPPWCRCARFSPAPCLTAWTTSGAPEAASTWPRCRQINASACCPTSAPGRKAPAA